MNSVNIEAVLNGWKVQVGCQQIVFTDAEVLCRELRSYLTNPEEVTKRYLSECVNRKWLQSPPHPGGPAGPEVARPRATAESCEAQAPGRENRVLSRP